jgi:hypothetical protein
MVVVRARVEPGHQSAMPTVGEEHHRDVAQRGIGLQPGETWWPSSPGISMSSRMTSGAPR